VLCAHGCMHIHTEKRKTLPDARVKCAKVLNDCSNLEHRLNFPVVQAIRFFDVGFSEIYNQGHMFANGSVNIIKN
jgi:hypothetical protein